jgi:hypothetical protein
MQPPPNGVAVGAIALFAIYLPTFFMQAALRGINAAVMGILTKPRQSLGYKCVLLRWQDDVAGGP